MLNQTRPLARLFSNTANRYAGHGYAGGIPGENLPFSLKMGRLKFTILFSVYFGVGLGAPFFVLWHQLRKK